MFSLIPLLARVPVIVTYAQFIVEETKDKYTCIHACIFVGDVRNPDESVRNKL